MGILKLKVIDAAGAAMTGQTVKVTGAGALQTNAEGLVQFLIDGDATLDIEINGATAWSGTAAQLVKDEIFQVSGAGFTRATAG